MKTINDDAFAYMVAEEVKNKLSPAQREELLKKDNWSRWQEALLVLVSNLNMQLEELNEQEEQDNQRFSNIGSRRMQKEMHNAYSTRRTKIERFRFHVNKRLDEVTAMIETGVAPNVNVWEKVEFLKRAIFEHRKMMHENDMEATPIDLALWAALSERWEFDNIDTSLL